MRIFISHISEHAELASALKQVVVDAYPECEVFVSSDTRDIPPGADWRERIDDALEEASAFLVLCSPGSVLRPWIPFEIACGWSKQVPVIPLCHSGMTKGKLPAPISRFQAIDVTPGFVETLLKALAGHFGLNTPRLDFRGMEEDVIEAMESASEPHTGASEKDEDPDDAEFLEEVEEEILKLLATGALSPVELGDWLDMHTEKARYLCEKLEKDGYVEFLRSMVGEPSAFAISSRGRAYLVENDLLE